MRLLLLFSIGLLCLEAPEHVETKAMLRHFEGFAAKPYAHDFDPGTCYAGYGHQLGQITREQAERWLDEDLERGEGILRRNLGVLAQLTPVRRSALIQLGYQVGPYELLGFDEMIAALERGDYELAGVEALRSKRARQTPKRARVVAGMLGAG